MPALIKEPEPALGHRAAIGTGANANLAGAAGTSDSNPKGTAGTESESGKLPKKNHRGGNRSTTAARGSRKTFTSRSAQRISALRAKTVFGDLREKEKAMLAAKKEAKRLGNALADLGKEDASNTRPGTQPEGEASLGEGAGPSGEVTPAQEVPESLTAAPNREEGEDALDNMDVDISNDLAALNEALAHESDSTFRNQPIRREKQ